jgi:hypothetical protein
MEYVYFFRENNRPYVKIGLARNDVNSRFQSFKTYAPNGAYIVGQISTKDCVSLENKLHKDYENVRFNGEFFKLTDEEVYSIISEYDVNFGMVYEKINSLIVDYNLTMKEINDSLKIMHRKQSSQKTNVDILKYIQPATEDDLDINFLTNTDIIDFIESIDTDFEINQYHLGISLKNLGFIKKKKRLGKTVKMVYLCKM